MLEDCQNLLDTNNTLPQFDKKHKYFYNEPEESFGIYGRLTMKDKKKMIVGIVLLLGAVYFLINILTKEMESFYVTGLILFTILGLGFLRNARY